MVDPIVRDRAGKFAEHKHTPVDVDALVAFIKGPPSGHRVDPTGEQSAVLTQLSEHGPTFVRGDSFGRIFATVITDGNELTELGILESGLVLDAASLPEPGVEWQGALYSDLVESLDVDSALGRASNFAVTPTDSQSATLDRLDSNGRANTSIRRGRGRDAGTIEAITLTRGGSDGRAMRSYIDADGKLLVAERLAYDDETGETVWKTVFPRELKRIQKEGAF
ncbi:hypothetical protein [Agromyces humi]|uniref:hypothetical protein n=1 Tax=Agromyces humi TaxID=1766800 RepID=UPI00135B8F49|nr:hypothetical protein [Agromyces humi]